MAGPRFSIRPPLTLQGRQFLGPRGWSGIPIHPALTHFPVAAYVLAGAFDLISLVSGDGSGTARDSYLAATWVLLGGIAVSLLTALTGFLDWMHLPAASQIRRTANTHMTIMLSVTTLVLIDAAVRLGRYDEPTVPVGIAVLTIVIAGLVSLGSAYGGALISDLGSRVRTADTDIPEWQPSDRDRFPSETE